ncbi:MAG TPA: glycosyltransferase, partial [Nitrospiria bacterium]|nr:glycosyltransferase [Nitrospiria bacterium]
MKVSVIVPVYNNQESIKKCIEALLGQDYPNNGYEVIVVDDGSDDGTAGVVKAYPLKYIYQKNQGPAAARNRGAGEAKGDIILFTDSDCVPDPDWIREMVKPFDVPDVVAVKGAYKTNQRAVTARFAQIEFEERFNMLKKAESIDMVDTYSAGFRRGVFLEMKGFDTSFPVANNEDTELSYRMSRLGFRMVFNPNAIVYHLNHPDTIMRYARLKFWRGYWRMVVYKRFPDKMIKDTYTPQTLKLQILSLFFFFAVLPLIPLFPAVGIFLLLLGSLSFLVLSVPFTVLAFSKDPVVGLLAPFLLLVR